MKTILKYETQNYLLLILIFCTSLINAQITNSFDILITGNISKYHYNDELLKKWQKASHDSENLAFLMLGNIYNSKENNFPNKLFLDYQHPLILAPGEREWANGSSSGKKMIKDIQDKLQELYRGPVYMPEAACPGPKEIILSDNLVVILLDTHWWVHKFDRRFNRCGIEKSGEVLVLIEDAIRRHYPTKHVVIAGHHSLKSFGNSDGYFSLKQNILKVPYILFRKFLGTRKDNHHPDFKEFRDAMLSILKKYPDVIYTSAGDANLQYFSLDKIHHIISGSLIETGFVRSNLAEFGSSEKGFACLSFFDGGKCELIFKGLKGELYRKTIYQRTFNNQQKNILVQLPDSMTVKASGKYNIPNSSKFWLGENYRNIWETPIKVRVFDITTQNGGLQILKRGGGFQTRSLRMEDKNGRQYVLRSIEKNVEPALPAEFKNTIAVDLVQDQMSTSNPYGALVVAELAEYAGIYHTNPEVVFVPDDPNLGIYRQDVAGQLFLFEERPDGNRSDVVSFGNSENIISTQHMIEKIHEDNNHIIDSDAYLRARLFDTLINDWDRHEDQWRWASHKINGKTIYRPIPRDRDQAFLKIEGVIGWIATRKWLNPKYQNFEEITENIPSLAFNARILDRVLMSNSGWEDWQKQIDVLKTNLTNERIDKAVLKFPKEIQPFASNETAEMLKARLENLEPMARELYLFLAKEVSITGTNEKDQFVINVPNETTISIVRYHKNNKMEKGNELYNRDFSSSETKRIRIYGLDKKDHFLINGNAKSKIKLSIIGGDNKDNVNYRGENNPRYIYIYDEKNTNLSQNIKTRITTSYDANELEYDRTAFKYDTKYPGLFMGYNQDDGVFWGGGYTINNYSRYNHQTFKIHANYASLTNAYNFLFEGYKHYQLKQSELNILIDVKSPNFVNNYFGMGNETKLFHNKLDEDYYRIRIKEYYIQTEYLKILGINNINKIGFGFFYKHTKVEDNLDRFILNFAENNLYEGALLPHSYASVFFNYELNTIPIKELKKEDAFGGSNMLKTRGMQLETEITYFKGLNDDSPDFTKLSGEGTSYLSFSSRPRVVYAVSFGGEKNFGDYVFHEAAQLGQNENLRGFRHTRFYGDASIYLNAEIRIRIKQFKSYILNGTTGLFLFNDIGRVWLDKEDSSLWHKGYGVGIWWSLFDMALLTFSYAGSQEDELYNLSLNFQF